MHKTLGNILLAAVFTVPCVVYGQFDFKVDGRPVQVHGFASQGFIMDGAPTGNAVRGFYPQVNPSGLRQTTTMLAIRRGYHS